ncbi:unnamed protein product [Phytophthora lilii]|uniref:Unnamed protein product n=1 Tax=Phytophthora lilii TaxID=2077276 RepID=A0A9W6YKR8_9STRA|nr:unnamed protein product [Phytophthora lilii]
MCQCCAFQFEQAGVKEDDLLVILSNPSAAPAAARPAVPSAAGFTARPGMKLHEIPEVRMVLMQMHMEAASRKFEEQQEIEALERNPFDAEAQAKIAERIRLSNVQKNMEIAIEEMPEAFARVTMLYIPCEVNGTQVKAFVDSGAQSTIMSSFSPNSSRKDASMAGSDEFREDLYEILGLEPAADERQVARAYKQKSILHHPDRGGDVQKFLELTHARDILLDPKKKEAYDKKLSRELLAKKQQREREAELDGKRRQMRDGAWLELSYCLTGAGELTGAVFDVDMCRAAEEGTEL